MTATACPHPFPFRFHRTLEQVDHDERRAVELEAQRARYAAQKRSYEAKRKAMAG